MMKRCEDPAHRRRHHARHQFPAMSARSQASVEPTSALASQVGRPGAVSGAALRGARLSAGTGQAELASVLGVTESTIGSWERGSAPLASVPFPDLERLKAVLLEAGAGPRLVADIEVAAWCDLVIDAIAHGEDTSCLMADPLAREAAFSELLAWSLAGVIPARHRPYAAPGPLPAG